MKCRWRLVLTLMLLAGALATVRSNSAQDRIASLTADDLARGKTIFNGQCALCHGIGGAGSRCLTFDPSDRLCQHGPCHRRK